MAPGHPEYTRFLERLHTYERLEPFPKSRGPEKLEGIRRLVKALGHPESAFQVVHVAGTNGKGLTSAMIAALLRQAGRAVGLYTSPHVLDIRERIVLGGRQIDEAAFARAGHPVLDVADTLREAIHFSYFDLLTAIAFVAFRDASLAWAVLETGLGGSSDATNITGKALCVLTRIGLDHMHVLGDTVEEIALQKLGIVRPGVPTVLGEQDAALTSWLLARLAERGSPVHAATAFRLEVLPGPPERLRAAWPDGAAVELSGAGFPPLTVPRLACVANALAAGEVLLGPARGEARCERMHTVLAAYLPGRLELRQRQRLAGTEGPVLEMLVLDGGHNVEALSALVAQLRRWDIAEYTLVLSLQVDKLVESVRSPLGELVAGAARLVTLRPQTARAPSEDALRSFLSGLGAPGRPLPPVETCAGPREALLAAAETPQRPVVVAGSFWTLGDVMRLLEPAPPEG